MSIKEAVDQLRENLKAARDDHGISAVDVAKAGGIPSFSTVYRFMNGDGVSIDTVYALEKAWGKIQPDLSASKRSS